MFKQVIVVEGKNDEALIKQIFSGIEVIKTNGSAINEQTIKEISLASLTKEVILFLDPDGPGEKIRRTIMEKVPNCSHAYIKKSSCISKNHRKVGVEHADEKLIKEALSNRLTVSLIKGSLTIDDLYELGLLGMPDSAIKRNIVCDKLSIGPLTAKTFLKKMNLFYITKEDIIRYLQGE